MECRNYLQSCNNLTGKIWNRWPYKDQELINVSREMHSIPLTWDEEIDTFEHGMVTQQTIKIVVFGSKQYLTNFAT